MLHNTGHKTNSEDTYTKHKADAKKNIFVSEALIWLLGLSAVEAKHNAQRSFLSI